MWSSSRIWDEMSLVIQINVLCCDLKNLLIILGKLMSEGRASLGRNNGLLGYLLLNEREGCESRQKLEARNGRRFIFLRKLSLSWFFIGSISFVSFPLLHLVVPHSYSVKNNGQVGPFFQRPTITYAINLLRHPVPRRLKDGWRPRGIKDGHLIDGVL